MSILQKYGSLEQRFFTLTAQRLWHISILCLLLLLTIGLLLLAVAQPPAQTVTIVVLWSASFVPYLLACTLVLARRSLPNSGSREQWLELGIIILGAFILRALLLPIEPIFSSDAWRYLWDARVTLHGFSPYSAIPNSPALVPLHDSLIYGHMGYREVPTLYPPVAQAIYLFSYLLVPSNLFVLKTIFMGFDLATCVLLAFWLKRKGLDPARCIIYAWCPLPIVEFAINGHIDVAMIPCVLLMIICAHSNRPGARALTGLLLGLATLIKLYPIILLIAVIRRPNSLDHLPAQTISNDERSGTERVLAMAQHYTYLTVEAIIQLIRYNYLLVLTCVLTIIVGYLPYYILGHGEIFGFFWIYLKQYGGNGGIVVLLVQHYGEVWGQNKDTIASIRKIADLAFLAIVVLPVFVLRWRERLSMEAATLILLGAIFMISSFVYPWYITVLLPWVALLIGSWYNSTGKGLARLNAKHVAVSAAWYFVCASIVGYLFLGRTFHWGLYYILIYAVVCALLVLAAIAGYLRLQTASIHRR